MPKSTECSFPYSHGSLRRMFDPFAFMHCSNVKKNGVTTYVAECNICGKKVNTSAHKLMYGHYLQKPKQNLSIQCVAVSLLARNYSTFFQELEKRWERLESKRTIKTNEANVAVKKRKALEDVKNGAVPSAAVGDADFSSESMSSDHSSTSAGNAVFSGEHALKIDERPWGFLPPAEKQRRRDECQAAWDLAFAVCGIRFQTVDHPAFREAIVKTRMCPDFRPVCRQTMSTTRLNRLNEIANKYKQRRLMSGAELGFVITSDGWRSCAKRNYHNYILISAEGPIFLNLQEVTGRAAAAEDIKAGFDEQFAMLDPAVKEKILIGITDTPSANVRAWRLLEAAYPQQFWIGCAAHEISLLFKEWIKKVPDILHLFREGHRVVKWINNHAEILKIFRDLVPLHFKEDKRKHSMMLYQPGDTRMLTVFKMLYRIRELWPVLSDLVGRPEYAQASQKALKAYSDAQKPENKLPQVSGWYTDKVKNSILSNEFKTGIDGFLHCTRPAVFLHRLVDGQSPVLGKFYYSCALVDKFLRVLKENQALSHIDAMHKIYMKRWKRWHRPLHTFAYAVDPCYQAHTLTREERKDCESVIKKLGGANWPKLKMEFDRWRSAGETIFDEEVWKAADESHGYQWWLSFGDHFEYLNIAAARVLSKPISASACEFNWSDVSHVITRKTSRLLDSTAEKIVNVRAMERLEKSISQKVVLGKIPKLDDIIDSIVNEAIDRSPNQTDDSGLDSADVDPSDCGTDDDESLDVVAEDEDPLYELGGAVNDGLDRAITALVVEN